MVVQEEAKLARSQTSYTEYNEQLRADLADFYAKRNQVIDPAFNALMTLQLQFYTETAQAVKKFEGYAG